MCIRCVLKRQCVSSHLQRGRESVGLQVLVLHGPRRVDHHVQVTHLCTAGSLHNTVTVLMNHIKTTHSPFPAEPAHDSRTPYNTTRRTSAHTDTRCLVQHTLHTHTFSSLSPLPLGLKENVLYGGFQGPRLVLFQHLPENADRQNICSVDSGSAFPTPGSPWIPGTLDVRQECTSDEKESHALKLRPKGNSSTYWHGGRGQRAKNSMDAVSKPVGFIYEFQHLKVQ